MRRLIFLAPLVIACSGGSSSSLSSSATTEFMSTLANVGVKCLHREPPPFHACVGLDAGTGCTVPDDADAGVGACMQLHDGRMVCAGPDDDDAEHDGGIDDHDGGMHGGMGGMHGGWMGDGGIPAPIQAAIDACAGKAVDADCSVTFHMHGIQGACRLAPDGATLVCAPLCSNR